MVKVTHADDGNVDIKLSKDNWEILKDLLTGFQMEEENAVEGEEVQKLFSLVKEIHPATSEDVEIVRKKYLIE